MSTDVEGTCVAVEDQTEADWAMMYAEEQKRRIKAERRLKGMNAAMATLLKATQQAIDAVMQPANTSQEFMNSVVKKLAQTVMEAFDAEIMVNLCTFDPPWGIDKKYQDALRADNGSNQNLSPTDKRLRNEYFKQHMDFMIEGWESCLDEWKLICQEEGFNTVDEVRERTRQEFAIKVLMKSAHDEELLKNLQKQPNENVSH